MKTLLSGLVAVVMAFTLSACTVGGSLYAHDTHHGYHHDGGKHHVKHHRDHKPMVRKHHSEKVVKETKVEKK